MPPKKKKKNPLPKNKKRALPNEGVFPSVPQRGKPRKRFSPVVRVAGGAAKKRKKS